MMKRLWVMELAATHIGRGVDSCSADLQVPMIYGFFIELILTCTCRLVSRGLGELEPKYASSIDSFFGTSMVLLGKTGITEDDFYRSHCNIKYYMNHSSRLNIDTFNTKFPHRSQMHRINIPYWMRGELYLIFHRIHSLHQMVDWSTVISL